MSEYEASPPWQTGAQDLSDDVYNALVPLDGFQKGSRGGPRPYTYEGRWWVVVGLSDFGDLLVGSWGPLAAEAAYAVPRHEDAVRTYLAQRVTELEAENARLRAEVAQLIRDRAGLRPAAFARRHAWK